MELSLLCSQPLPWKVEFVRRKNRSEDLCVAGPMVTALNPGTGAQVTEPELCEKSLVGTAYTQLPVLTWISMGQKPQTFHSLQQPVSESLGDGTVSKSMRA